eukprot:m.167585 g.167585  ORF g.167585 m.167585 type:complete len:1757 (+) comp16455_c0_seq1:144-5414(+)
MSFVSGKDLLGRRPTPFNYACMSLLTYRDMGDEHIKADTIGDAIEGDTRLPSKKLKLSVDAWHALRHDGWEVLEQCKRDSGMICTVFFHSERQQLVFAYRGTQPSNFKSVKADVLHVMRDKAGTINDHAVEIAKKYATHRIFQKYKFLQVSTTGHSLGAWEAELVVFQLKLEFALHLRDLPNAYARIWAVTFESPGSRVIMESKQNGPSMLHKINIVDSLDITTYMSKPNYINTFNQQTTSCLYQILGETIDMAKGTIEIHDMATVYAGMQEALTEPDNLRRCLAWPYRPWATAAQEATEPVELSLKDVDSTSHLYSGKFLYPLAELPTDIQDCLRNPDTFDVPQTSVLRTHVKLTSNFANNSHEIELAEGVSLDDIKNEFFVTVRIPQICKENNIDPALAMNYAADIEQENADSVVEQRYSNFQYFGQINNHEQPHGFGMAYFDDGSRYIGVWLRGNYYGYGVYVSGDPSLPFEYRGQFRAGQIDGYGMLRLRATSKDITDRLTQRELDDAYVGQFEQGKFLRMVNAVALGLLAERQASKRAGHIFATCEKAKGLRKRVGSTSFHTRRAAAVGDYQQDWYTDHFSKKQKMFSFLSSSDSSTTITLQRNSILPLLERAACACHLSEVSAEERLQLLKKDYHGLFSHPEIQLTQSGTKIADTSQLIFLREHFKNGARRTFIIFSPEITADLSTDMRSPYIQNLLSLVPMDYLQSWLSRGMQIIVTGHSIGGMLALMLCTRIINEATFDLDSLRKGLFCVTFGAPLLPDAWTLLGSLQGPLRNVWEDWCATNRHFVLVKEDPVPALGVFLRKKEWPRTYMALNAAGMLSSRDQCSPNVNLGALQLEPSVLNTLKKKAIEGTPWILADKTAKNVAWSQVFQFVKDVQSNPLMDIQTNCTYHAINLYVSVMTIAVQSLKSRQKQDTVQTFTLTAPGETDVDADLDMNTTIVNVWIEVADDGVTHFCLSGVELRLLSDVYVLPFADTTELQLGTVTELPEGSVLIWSRDERNKDDVKWDQVSITDTQVDFTVKLERSRVLTLLNLSEALVVPRHIKGALGHGKPRSKVAGLTLYARSLLCGQVIPVSMENITLPRANSHMQSYLSSHCKSRDLARMAYLKAVFLRQAMMRLAHKNGVSQEQVDKLLQAETIEHEDAKLTECLAGFASSSSSICKLLDEPCTFLDLSAILLAWLRVSQEETDERQKAMLRNTFRAIIMTYFKLGPYASQSDDIMSAAYRYTLPTSPLPEDLLQPLKDLLDDVGQVNLPSKACKWDGFLPNYTSLIADISAEFRQPIAHFSFKSALQSQPTDLETALDPSSLQQTRVLLHAENGVELFHTFFDGDFPFHSKRTVDRFWASVTSLPSSVLFSLASAVVKPFAKDDASHVQSFDYRTAYLRRHRQFQQATITGFNMKLALLARLLPESSSDFSCLSVIEEAIQRQFTNISSVEALKERLRRHEQQQEGLSPLLQKFAENMTGMGVSSSENPHAYETICRWIYAVTNIRQPLFEHLMKYPIIGVYGAQGAGKSLLLNQLGFDTKSAFGDGNTKAFDVHPVSSTGALIVDSFGFNEAVGEGQGDAAQQEFLRCKDMFGNAFLGQLRYVIYVSSSSSQRDYNKEEDESLVKLRNVPCHVLYLITKFDSFLKRFGDDEMDVAHEEARRILTERRKRNAQALPGKKVETRFYSSVSPHGFERVMDEAYAKLNGDFWRPDDLKEHMRKVLVLHCEVSATDAADALGMEIDLQKDALGMPQLAIPTYTTTSS